MARQIPLLTSTREEQYLISNAQKPVVFDDFPDDWLKNLFIYIEFRKRSRFQRCSHRWCRLLGSKFVMRNLLVCQSGSYSLTQAVSQRLMAAFVHYPPLIENIFFTGTSFDWGDTAWWITKALVPVDPPWGESSLPRVNLFVQNLQYCHRNFLSAWNGTFAFGNLQFQKVTFNAATVLDQLFIDDPDADFACRQMSMHYNTDAVDLYLNVSVPGPCLIQATTPVEAASQIRTMLLAHMQKPLHSDQLQELARRISLFDADTVRDAFSILQRFERHLNAKLPGIEDLDKPGYALLPPAVSRILLCWDGTVDRSFKDEAVQGLLEDEDDTPW